MPRASLDTAALRVDMGGDCAVVSLILGVFKDKVPLDVAFATALQTTKIREARVTVRPRQFESS